MGTKSALLHICHEKYWLIAGGGRRKTTVLPDGGEKNQKSRSVKDVLGSIGYHLDLNREITYRP